MITGILLYFQKHFSLFHPILLPPGFYIFQFMRVSVVGQYIGILISITQLCHSPRCD